MKFMYQIPQHFYLGNVVFKFRLTWSVFYAQFWFVQLTPIYLFISVAAKILKYFSKSAASETTLAISKLKAGFLFKRCFVVKKLVLSLKC